MICSDGQLSHASFLVFGISPAPQSVQTSLTEIWLSLHSPPKKTMGGIASICFKFQSCWIRAVKRFRKGWKCDISQNNDCIWPFCKLTKWQLFNSKECWVEKRGCVKGNKEIHNRGVSPVFDFFLCSPYETKTIKSCLNELKFWEVSENPKSSICLRFHLSLSKTGESPFSGISVFPITHPLLSENDCHFVNLQSFAMT